MNGLIPDNSSPYTVLTGTLSIANPARHAAKNISVGNP
jgi:hypothetical protein